ncbi:hypothetical protein NC653_020138 [Populus alba x Populus x berolinensis]|uniref:Uncharacterized protein n=1 Tax=Populus alba x Populus x berolinensis TaxID=444605 RepID=A0AAD6MJU3_9ROSI|nr:hypothetical protein NC653_020138 [Populus alba x Populus x berolinensis]
MHFLAAIAWHESRRKWTGNQSCQPQRTTKDPIIRVHIVNLASAINEEKIRTLLHFLMADTERLTEIHHCHLQENVRASYLEMVDFLVDIWHDEGLFD